MAKRFLLIMGVQGAGKGTQATRLCARYNLLHISTGDLFRAMRSRTDDLAKRVQETINAGILVDDATTNAVLQDRLEQADVAGYAGVLLDGYPRNLAQAQWLTDYLAGTEYGSVTGVLLLNLDLYEAFKRSFGRISSKDGRSFNIYSNARGVSWTFEKDASGTFPPRLAATDSETGEALTRRADDANAFAVIDRIEKYLAETEPVLPYYRAGGLLHEVDARLPIDAVTEALFAHLGD
jgi:adenylate kinase